MGYRVKTRSVSLGDEVIHTQEELIHQLDNGDDVKDGQGQLAVIQEKAESEPPKKRVTKLSARDQKLTQYIVGQIKDELQTWALPSIVAREQFMTDCWMKNAQALVNNAKMASNINLKLEKAEGVNNLEKINKKLTKPGLGSFEEFLYHPSTGSFWEFLRITQIDPYSATIESWWNKVTTTPNPQNKLDKYLTAMSYYNQLSLQFWSTVAYNITMESQESIVATLTRLGDFIRLSGLDCPLTEEYFRTAEIVAKQSPKVSDIREQLKLLWPANLNISNLHYKKSR